MYDAPELIVQEGGMPIAVRKDFARSPAAAIRSVIEDFGYESLVDDVAGKWSEDEERFVLNYGELLAFVKGVKPAWMRLAVTDDEKSGPFGEEAWFWCEEDTPGAVAYWDLGLD